ncbi:uncharacterized protein PV09_04720 [Verruconis gallopava]|uniref:Uncharacterized protein n=1 Tax=Verruconis gallopava TaxID=253628 RepID=A0A0D2ADD4_9PEZI|nr:uncharacterized protein PV09_04720 [Verruconis gallopava]KIW04455.1 hypothetical protein PV09_04720 [Verruconis gallopava]
MIIARRFSITNFAIATSALCFQVFVLYPWHQKLEDEFKDLRREYLEKIRENEQARIRELKAIRDLLGKAPEL